MSYKVKPIKCMNPVCAKERKHFALGSRGLCPACYTMANNLVREHKTTWGQLEKDGKCLPPFRDNWSPAYRWFMDYEPKSKTKEAGLREHFDRAKQLADRAERMRRNRIAAKRASGAAAQ